MWRNQKSGYGLISIVVHWLMAFAVIGLFALGLYMVDLSYYDPFYHQALSLHKSIGMLLVALFIFRLIWISLNPKPKMLGDNHKLILLAKGVHGLLYLLLFVLFISGYLISSAAGNGIELFNWIVIPAITAIGEQANKAGNIHAIAAYSLIVLVALHALAAIKHQIIDKDDTLKRMLKPIKPNTKE